MMKLNCNELNKVFNIEGPEFIEVDKGEEPIYSNFRSRPGMHSPEGRLIIAAAARERTAKTWNIYYDDGRVETVWNLEGWCNERGYDADNVRKVGKMMNRGFIYRSYKGIIKIEDKNEPSDYNPWKWRIKFNCGKQVKVFSLNKWCKLNDANAGALVAMSKGKKDKYKNIIKVEKLEKC